MQLLIQEPGRPPRAVLASAGLTIGRGAANSCVLQDDSASSRHAQIVLEGGALAIEDAGSSNGTRIRGGARLGRGERAQLVHGLEIQIGRTTLRVVAEGVSEQTLLPGGAADELTLRPGSAVEDESTLRPASKPAPSPSPAPAADEMRTLRPAPAAPAPVEDESTLIPRKAAPAPAPIVPVAPSAPAPVQAAVPAAPAPQPRPAAAAPLDDLDIGGGTLYVSNAATDPAAVQATLAALHPRLVLVVKKTGRTEPVVASPLRIGRVRAGDVALAIEDEGVSSRHAELSFDGQSFYLEDLGGKNGTWAGGTRLAPGGGRAEVKCDMHLRFGTVDALFVRDPRTGETPGPGVHYASALELLQSDPAIPKEKLREAERLLQSGGHPGELLVAQGAATVEQWCGALERARLRGMLRADAGAGSGRRIMLVLVAALVAALAVIGWLLFK